MEVGPYKADAIHARSTLQRLQSRKNSDIYNGQDNDSKMLQEVYNPFAGAEIEGEAPVLTEKGCYAHFAR